MRIGYIPLEKAEGIGGGVVSGLARGWNRGESPRWRVEQGGVLVPENAAVPMGRPCLWWHLSGAWGTASPCPLPSPRTLPRARPLTTW